MLFLHLFLFASTSTLCTRPRLLPQSPLQTWPSTWSKPVWWNPTLLQPWGALPPPGRSSLSSGPMAAPSSRPARESGSLTEAPPSPSSTWAATTVALSGAVRSIESATAPVKQFTSPSAVSIYQSHSLRHVHSVNHRWIMRTGYWTGNVATSWFFPVVTWGTAAKKIPWAQKGFFP